MGLRFALVVTLAAAASAPAWAHGGHPPTPEHLWTAWSWEPAVLLGLVTGAAAYGAGLRRLWRRVGARRGITPWRAAAFAAGLAAAFLALVSPLDALGEALFSGHMVQHLVLVLVAAPLLVLGEPLVAVLWALPRAARHGVARWWLRSPAIRRAASAITHPVTAWLAHAAALWAWHAPRWYDAAVAHEGLHALEHASFFATALLFWWALLGPAGRLRMPEGAGLLYLFTFAMQAGALGALITLAGRPWYAAHAATTEPWGLTPLEDQQVAGAIMWVPGSLPYLFAVVTLFVRWMATAERRVRLAQGAAPKSRAP